MPLASKKKPTGPSSVPPWQWTGILAAKKNGPAGPSSKAQLWLASIFYKSLFALFLDRGEQHNDKHQGARNQQTGRQRPSNKDAPVPS